MTLSGPWQRSILRGMTVENSDSPPTLYVVHGRAKPVVHGPHSTEPNLFQHGENTFRAVNDRIMCLPNNFCHYSSLYIRQKVVLWFEHLSVVLQKQFISAESTSVCPNNTISVTIFYFPPKTTLIQLNLSHFLPLWDHLIVREKQKLSVIFSPRNWFLRYGKKCVAVVHWFRVWWLFENATVMLLRIDLWSMMRLHGGKLSVRGPS